MLLADRERNRERARATAGVLAFHGLLGWALIAGFDVDVPLTVSDNLKLFDVPEPPPPPTEVPVPVPRAAEAREGAAAAPNLEARPSIIVAPPPRLPVSSPIAAAPEPTPLPPGPDPSAGNSNVPGTGTGAGGEGIGAGGGGQGDGSGGGARAQRVSGRLSGETDYPPAARRAGIQGSVAVRYIVGTDGRISGCRVTRSSGNADLDGTTCRLIEQRFRYRPARDAQGRPIPQPITRTFDWLLPFRR